VIGRDVADTVANGTIPLAERSLESRSVSDVDPELESGGSGTSPENWIYVEGCSSGSCSTESAMAAAAILPVPVHVPAPNRSIAHFPFGPDCDYDQQAF
jgi:hypothetical protein